MTAGRKFFGLTHLAENIPATAKARLLIVSVRLTAAVGCPSSAAIGEKKIPPALVMIPREEDTRPHMARRTRRYLPRVFFSVVICFPVFLQNGAVNNS